MPPQMEGKHAIGRPGIGAGRKVLGPLLATALHFHDMRDGMHGPAILWVQGNRLAPLLFGLAVIP
ncbi:hypothetical protein D3C79_873640 [compost metagenome]